MIDYWTPGSLSNTFFQWAALFFLMTTRLLDFLLALSEEKNNLSRCSVLRLRSESIPASRMNLLARKAGMIESQAMCGFICWKFVVVSLFPFNSYSLS